MMMTRSQDICCSICNKYLFTEIDTEKGYRRENDIKDYQYDETADNFICIDCLRAANKN